MEQSEKKQQESSTDTSDVSPAVPTEVIAKLIAFSIAMICAPLAVYFLGVNTLFRGNATLAGAAAAITANVVLVAYIVVAWREDREDLEKRRKKKIQ
ncbi:hypothetical protein VTN49DRAFT_4926 [Thermomyces lanuginosus]|uniref:uncharacterized protein n=1 Tax=Thermomyces lanuginosus TaxID=5541 RepID=UPI0037448ED3